MSLGHMRHWQHLPTSRYILELISTRKKKKAIICRFNWKHLNELRLVRTRTSSQWSVLLFYAHWHRLRPSHSKGTFTNHHHCALPALCSQNCLSCIDTAHKLKRQTMRGLHSCPGHCLICPIYPTSPPYFPSCVMSLLADARSHSVLRIVVNGLF